MALSLVLLVVAGVLLHSVAGYRNEDYLGFNPRHIVAAVDLSAGRYQNRNIGTNFYRWGERVSHLPGVEGAGLVNLVPIQNWGWSSEIRITGRPPLPASAVTLAEVRFTTPGYCDAMGIHLLRGRMLSPSIDLATGKRGTVDVNQAFCQEVHPEGA